MTGTPVLVTAGVLLLIAVIALVALIATGGRTVSLARRRPAGTPQNTALNRAAEGATRVAARALGDRAGNMSESLDLAGIRMRPQDFMVVLASGMVALFAAGLLLWGPLGGLLLLLAAPLIAFMVVRWLTARRRKAFSLQLDETLSTLAGSLRAGYSLPQACSTVASEAQAPTSEVFARVINEARVGRPFIEALQEAAQRMRIEDFFWIVQAIAINREVGGNLADVLDGVGLTIRERTHLKRQVDSLSAEGRLSAVILGALPIVVFLLLSLVNPAYIGKFGESVGSMALLVLAGIMLILGLLWLRVLVKIKY